MVLVSLVLCTASLFAVNVELNSSPYVKNQNNIDAFTVYLRDVKNFRANKEADLDKNLHDDWMLANNYLSKHITPLERAEVTNMVNRYLAAKEIRRVQESIQLSDDIVKSYYLDNLDKYRLKPMLNLTLFTSKNLDKAREFYDYASSHNIAQAKEYADKNSSKIVYKDYSASENRTVPVIRRAMRDMNSTNYFTPPLFHIDSFLVVYVDNIEQRSGYVEYERVKSSIVKLLRDKTFIQERKKIVEKLSQP